MRYFLLIILTLNLSFAAYPKVFQTVGDKVYPYIKTCKNLRDNSELGKLCDMFYTTAEINIKLGKRLDARKDDIRPGDTSISKYIKTLQFLEITKDEMVDLIFKNLNNAIRKGHGKTVSKLFTAANMNYKKSIYKKIDSASLNLTREAQKKLGRYTNKKIRKKVKTQQKRVTIAKKKEQAVFCHYITQKLAMSSDYGVTNGLVVGKAKLGYILQSSDGKRMLLDKAGAPKYGVLEQVSIEVRGRGAARKVAYVFFDGINKMRKSETLPLIKYKKESKKVCRN